MLLLLSGCSSHLNNAFHLLFPKHSSLEQKAADLPYASLLFVLDGRKGLVVMAYLAHDNSYFLASGQVSLTLKNGYLQQLGGTLPSLLMTQVTQDNNLLTAPWQQAEVGIPVHYQVLREWRDADTQLHADRAQASLACTAASPTKLALQTLPLQACTETLVWSNGKKTTSTLWRNPTDKHLWRVQTQPWPGAPSIEWQVAKAWW